MNDDLEMQIAVVGGGPAGLMAAETALAAGGREWTSMMPWPQWDENFSWPGRGE